jgi:hypothetical protein
MIGRGKERKRLGYPVEYECVVDEVETYMQWTTILCDANQCLGLDIA